MPKQKMFFALDPGSDTVTVLSQSGQNTAIKDTLNRVREFVKTRNIVIVSPARRTVPKQIDADSMISIARPMVETVRPHRLTILKNRNQLHQKKEES